MNMAYNARQATNDGTGQDAQGTFDAAPSLTLSDMNALCARRMSPPACWM
jgi:hypothetical protein